MTDKRFVSEDNCCGYYTEVIDNEKELDLSIPNPKKNLTLKELVDLLNELHEENSMLKESIQRFIHENDILREQLGVDLGMMDKEVTVDLNELDINIQKEIIFKSDLNKWIEKKMDYYEKIIEKTDGYNNVSAKGHLDMLIGLKEWIKQR